MDLRRSNPRAKARVIERRFVTTLKRGASTGKAIATADWAEDGDRILYVRFGLRPARNHPMKPKGGARRGPRLNRWA